MRCNLSSPFPRTLLTVVALASGACAITQLSDGTQIEVSLSVLFFDDCSNRLVWLLELSSGSLPMASVRYYSSFLTYPRLFSPLGILTQGCSLPTSIQDCYGVNLSPDPTANLDTHFPTSPRQRMECRTFYHNAGTRFYFTWKQYFPSSISTFASPSSFFHIMQIFDVDINNPALTLDAVNGTLKINDFAGDKCRDQCPAVPLAYYSDRTTLHAMEVTFGPSGRIDYAIWDAATGYEVFEYHGTGNLGGNSS